MKAITVDSAVVNKDYAPEHFGVIEKGSVNLIGIPYCSKIVTLPGSVDLLIPDPQQPNDYTTLLTTDTPYSTPIVKLNTIDYSNEARINNNNLGYIKFNEEKGTYQYAELDESTNGVNWKDFAYGAKYNSDDTHNTYRTVTFNSKSAKDFLTVEASEPKDGNGAALGHSLILVDNFYDNKGSSTILELPFQLQIQVEKVDNPGYDVAIPNESFFLNNLSSEGKTKFEFDLFNPVCFQEPNTDLEVSKDNQTITLCEITSNDTSKKVKCLTNKLHIISFDRLRDTAKINLLVTIDSSIINGKSLSDLINISGFNYENSPAASSMNIILASNELKKYGQILTFDSIISATNTTKYAIFLDKVNEQFLGNEISLSCGILDNSPAADSITIKGFYNTERIGQYTMNSPTYTPVTSLTRNEQNTFKYNADLQFFKIKTGVASFNLIDASSHFSKTDTGIRRVGDQKTIQKKEQTGTHEVGVLQWKHNEPIFGYVPYYYIQTNKETATIEVYRNLCPLVTDGSVFTININGSNYKVAKRNDKCYAETSTLDILRNCQYINDKNNISDANTAVITCQDVVDTTASPSYTQPADFFIWAGDPPADRPEQFTISYTVKGGAVTITDVKGKNPIQRFSPSSNPITITEIQNYQYLPLGSIVTVGGVLPKTKSISVTYTYTVTLQKAMYNNFMSSLN